MRRNPLVRGERQTVSERDFAAIVDAVKSLAMQNSTAGNLMVDQLGIHTRRIPPQRAGVQFEHFRVQAEHFNYVDGAKLDDDGTIALNQQNEPVLVKLAKPPTLRRSEYNNEVDGTITWAHVGVNQRVATDSSDGETEDQVIISRYLLPVGAFQGSLVLAMSGINNGTMVTVFGNPLVWQIVDARAFAKVFVEPLP